MMKIEPIQPHQVEAVKHLILTVCQEIFQVSAATILLYDDMADIDKMQTHYFANRGTFLVLLDEGKVVGSGGIRYWRENICELKRMWLLEAYRGKGWGKQIALMLIDFARQKGYGRIRLDVANAQKQARAIAFYHHLGFYDIERYNESPCTTFMEMTL